MISIFKEVNLTVKFGFAYRYTNFTLNTFFLNNLLQTDEIKSSINHEIEVRIYRFWAFDPKNDLPLETVYFLKMIQIINANNLNQSSKSNLKSDIIQKKQLYPKDGYNNITNYLIHSR